MSGATRSQNAVGDSSGVQKDTAPHTNLQASDVALSRDQQTPERSAQYLADHTAAHNGTSDMDAAGASWSTAHAAGYGLTDTVQETSHTTMEEYALHDLVARATASAAALVHMGEPILRAANAAEAALDPAATVDFDSATTAQSGAFEPQPQQQTPAGRTPSGAPPASLAVTIPGTVNAPPSHATAPATAHAAAASGGSGSFKVTGSMPLDQVSHTGPIDLSDYPPTPTTPMPTPSGLVEGAAAGSSAASESGSGVSAPQLASALGMVHLDRGGESAQQMSAIEEDATTETSDADSGATAGARLGPLAQTPQDIAIAHDATAHAAAAAGALHHLGQHVARAAHMAEAMVHPADVVDLDSVHSNLPSAAYTVPNVRAPRSGGNITSAQPSTSTQPPSHPILHPLKTPSPAAIAASGAGDTAAGGSVAPGSLHVGVLAGVDSSLDVPDITDDNGRAAARHLASMPRVDVTERATDCEGNGCGDIGSSSRSGGYSARHEPSQADVANFLSDPNNLELPASMLALATDEPSAEDAAILASAAAQEELLPSMMHSSEDRPGMQPPTPVAAVDVPDALAQSTASDMSSPRSPSGSDGAAAAAVLLTQRATAQHQHQHQQQQNADDANAAATASDTGVTRADVVAASASVPLGAAQLAGARVHVMQAAAAAGGLLHSGRGVADAAMQAEVATAPEDVIDATCSKGATASGTPQCPGSTATAGATAVNLTDCTVPVAVLNPAESGGTTPLEPTSNPTAVQAHNQVARAAAAAAGLHYVGMSVTQAAGAAEVATAPARVVEACGSSLAPGVEPAAASDVNLSAREAQALNVAVGQELLGFMPPKSSATAAAVAAKMQPQLDGSDASTAPSNNPTFDSTATVKADTSSEHSLPSTVAATANPMSPVAPAAEPAVPVRDPDLARDLSKLEVSLAAAGQHREEVADAAAAGATATAAAEAALQEGGSTAAAADVEPTFAEAGGWTLPPTPLGFAAPPVDNNVTVHGGRPFLDTEVPDAERAAAAGVPFKPPASFGSFELVRGASGTSSDLPGLAGTISSQRAGPPTPPVELVPEQDDTVEELTELGMSRRVLSVPDMSAMTAHDLDTHLVQQLAAAPPSRQLTRRSRRSSLDDLRQQQHPVNLAAQAAAHLSRAALAAAHLEHPAGRQLHRQTSQATHLPAPPELPGAAYTERDGEFSGGSSALAAGAVAPLHTDHECFTDLQVTVAGGTSAVPVVEQDSMGAPALPPIASAFSPDTAGGGVCAAVNVALASDHAKVAVVTTPMEVAQLPASPPAWHAAVAGTHNGSMQQHVVWPEGLCVLSQGSIVRIAQAAAADIGPGLDQAKARAQGPVADADLFMPESPTYTGKQ